MIIIKSQREIEIMKVAGKIVALAHQEIKKHIRPGISTYEIDKIVEDFIINQGAKPSFKGYGGFPGSACTSINEVVVHGIPSKKTILKDGDIIAIDIGAEYRGYHGDSAWTYAVGNISPEKKQLMEVTENSLYEGLKKAKAGNRLYDISNAIETYVRKFGYSIVEDFVGHGIGKNLHEDPAVPNFGEAGKGPLLKKGMALAIEPMVNLGTKEVKILLDNWTTVTLDGKASAHFEHTVIITDDECEITTTT